MTTSVPGVAIITRTKNRPLLLERAMIDVLSQSFQDWVHVIVNDGGNPEPVELLCRKFADNYHCRILLIHNDTSKGMEAASNIGLKASQSKYVVIHDDDDTWHPEFLTKSILALEQNTWPNTRGVVTHCTVIEEEVNDNKIKTIRRYPLNDKMIGVDISRMAASNPFRPISFLYERAVLESIGYYDESLPVVGDWDFHLRFLLSYEILVLKEPLSFYHKRVGESSTYMNSKKNLHREYELRLKNKWIREDIKKGILPMSLLVTLSGETYYFKERLWRASDKILSLMKYFPLLRSTLKKD
jgi:glycosyltransferase involved in cell wall biosynthesis